MKIIAAAIRYEDVVYSLPAPARHHDVCRLMVEKYLLPTDAQRDQGFLTDGGEYVDRYAACVIARAAGQLDVIRQKTGSQRELFSEDLW